ncbi:hypothetical protein MEN41_10675 [Dolichospermum sp. ST_con]|nr:hypothetical protein [Dolichospermum sp. ST_con]MDD1418066.1 hypothetical protein [Dolichospermum sp. ST_sed1]MDD1425006.1 hypothetical protein [Dolichospermum sp. ST_sed9]MDD1430217.1 hypothetical protein [Dolichospermum sp. ST_sed6]MDD1435595.1 hypothetical protein [Dolichospermum sp. ST_sed10]MDD1439577.1 hypothetical protein [Dolichospermum sp. ST_sed3]MDD1445386.1 hypothetical protein [Dolichospermum sp. ST_sed8]MDD1456437.1 hypothetical protein [Dolichospermum sp. ST_sed7]MDD145947
MAINIVALGGSGAGKSLYLASLYRKLMNSLIIDDLNEEKKLNKICQDVLTTTEGEVTTIGTSAFKEWKFKWQLATKSGKYNVGSFTYLDYGGGKITEIKETSKKEGKTSEQEKKLEKEIEKAHIVVIFLDGVKLIDLMRQKVGREELSTTSVNQINFWYQELFNSIACLKRNDCPIHFVITKWDALVFKGFEDLRAIENTLTKDLPALKELIDIRKELQSQPIRWIPISSLGMNIAEPIYDSEGTYKKMGLKKIDGCYANTIDPMDVDIVLSYAMIDTLKSKLKDLEKVGIVSKIVAGVGVDFILDALPFPFNLVSKYAKPIFEAIYDCEQVGKKVQDKINMENIKNRKDALVYMISEHQQKIKKFEKKFEEEIPPTVQDEFVSSPQS